MSPPAIALTAVIVCAADVVATGVPRAQIKSKLHVVAESPEFYTSSEVDLPGEHAPALTVFEFRNLPAGLHEITGVVVDTRGGRSTVSRLAKVEPGLGGR
jgi:hypothetical protein